MTYVYYVKIYKIKSFLRFCFYLRIGKEPWAFDKQFFKQNKACQGIDASYSTALGGVFEGKFSLRKNIGDRINRNKLILSIPYPLFLTFEFKPVA